MSPEEIRRLIRALDVSSELEQDRVWQIRYARTDSRVVPPIAHQNHHLFKDQSQSGIVCWIVDDLADGAAWAQ